MTHMIKIEAEDGHTLEAAVAGDPDTARGSVVVLQEIFGLNEHIRDLPRRFAEAGSVSYTHLTLPTTPYV